MCGDEAVCEGWGDHVEVSGGDDSATAEGGATEEFGDFPGLCGAVAEVGVVFLVRCVELLVLAGG